MVSADQWTTTAAYTTIPENIRALWSRRAGKVGTYKDIFLIETIGPLLLLYTFPNALKNALWIHFIDNEAGQHALIKGSSSIESGDEVIGMTWSRIQRLRLLFYGDRVDSGGNPTDGLSRGRMDGPWGQVYKATIPDELKHSAAEEKFQ